jgi:hypothetical protein
VEQPFRKASERREILVDRLPGDRRLAERGVCLDQLPERQAVKCFDVSRLGRPQYELVLPIPNRFATNARDVRSLANEFSEKLYKLSIAIPGIGRSADAVGDRSGRNRLLVAIEAVHLAVPRRQADGVADLMPVVAEDPRRQHPDLRNLDVEYGVGA